jgi:hypothetical protein
MQSQGADTTEPKILTNGTPIFVKARGTFERFHKGCIAIVDPAV